MQADINGNPVLIEFEEFKKLDLFERRQVLFDLLVEMLPLSLQHIVEKRRRQVEDDGPDGDLHSPLPWHGDHLVLRDPGIRPV